MKFAKEIAKAQQDQQYLPETAYIDYKGLKRGLEEQTVEDFTRLLGEQIQQVREELAAILVQKGCCDLQVGPVTCNFSCAKSTSAEFIDTLFLCVELNREACRKITKKFDKKHPDLPVQQMEKVMMHDAIMKSVIDDVEKWAQTVHPTPKLSTTTKATASIALLAIIAGSVTIIVVTSPPALQIAFGIGVVFAFLTAWGNAANDICNCVGTAVGCKALTLAQAVFGGVFFEVIGCVTLGPFVAKSITKGMIETEPFQDTPELFAWAMVCVLIGTAFSTLLATAYGFPISATHGIIGGLVAVGLAAKGSDSVGWEKLGKVAISWVVAPLSGAIVALGMYLLIQVTVLKSSAPAQRAKRLQPFFFWICIAVNVLFVFLKGPKSLRIEPIWLACVISAGVALAVVLIVYPILFYRESRRRAEAKAASQAKGDAVVENSDEEGQSAAPVPTSVAPPPAETSEPPMEVAKDSSSQNSFSQRINRLLVALNLAEDPAGEESATRRFSFRTEKKAVDEQVEDDEACEVKEAESYFVMLLVISAFSVAVAHGGNDVGNAVGPLAAVLAVYTQGTVAKTPEIPLWATLYGSLGFAIGIITMGRFTIKTVGTKITVLSPSKAFATQIGGACAVLSASSLGMPVSTSHCLVGAVVGIGLAQKLTGTGSVNLKVLTKIFIAWGLTIPLAMLAAVTVFYPFKSFFE